MAAPGGATGTLTRSNLTQQLEHDDGSLTPKSNKSRSVSELPPKPSLSPSPAFRESSQRVSKDDSVAVADPTTPRRPSQHMRGLSLQMPTKENPDGLSTTSSRIPLSPKLDSASIYGSPSSVLPRRSRGLDFARACTNLHHSTLAESSPDASPITGRGINIPQRRGLGNTGSILDSPSQNPPWSSLHGERTNLSSSISSINMMDSDSDSDDSSEGMAVDRDMDDPMLNTPAASKINGLAVTQSPGMEWLNNPPTNSQMSLLSFQPHRMSFKRARLRNNKSSHSSSSVSMRSTRPSPGPLSPPIRQSVENSGYFGMTRQQVRSRRESLSLGTDDLHLSDSDGEGDNKMNNVGSSGNDGSSERGVIKRAVTRRSNLLPKTKGFARIRAALMEESDPLHTEARREAEVIKQVQESDDVYPSKPENILGITTTAEPVEASIESGNGHGLSHETSNDSQASDTTTEPFSSHAKRNSGGVGFWNNFEHTPPSNIERYRTPPPPLMPQDSNASDDIMTSSSTPAHELSYGGSLLRQLHSSRSRSRSTTPLASAAASQAMANIHGNGTQPLTAGDVARKVNNKRRRDDDFDLSSFKRRAVSPSMVGSAHSSPVVPQSPTLNSDKAWGRPPPKTNADRSNSAGSTSANGPKRVGLQGMTEANDGFMGMSID
ncbi:hypothetical protein PMZ80_000474 [Knufia obscura]|uniref:Uncharacterized protein n=1 Tax=Knufia obscura TaxID=1635080 RepID=A0ABR0S0D6_9EURO|nr:hypothetical protein PMZ80_000474 [Knufia obscura]